MRLGAGFNASNICVSEPWFAYAMLFGTNGSPIRLGTRGGDTIWGGAAICGGAGGLILC